MPLNEPSWWYGSRANVVGLVLAPLGWLYGGAAWIRTILAKPYTPRVPVICIGNFTAGGTGKTPAAIVIAEHVRDLGREPVFLSRGYGGTLRGPVFADPESHRASDIGDEPLLLARTAKTVIARNRAEGARFIEETANARTVIIMDDGLQNPSIRKTLSIAIVDGRRGLGNGRIIPAGPLRAPLALQARLADIVVLNGADTPVDQIAGLPRLKSRFSGPVLNARTEPPPDARKLNGARLAAYAGIGNPERFFKLLEDLGASVAVRAAFPDHHMFTTGDANALLEKAAAANAALITTEKDLARLYGASSGALQRLADTSATLPVRLVFKEGETPILLAALSRAIQRRPG